jgi:quinol monooxygenase YgiN
MNRSHQNTVSLSASWFIRPGCKASAEAALKQLAIDVQQHEPDTLMYVIHTPVQADIGLESLPPASPLLVIFFETYRNADAFQKHLNGPVFTEFVKKHQELFVAANGNPFNLVTFLETRAGFIRAETLA